MATDLDRLYGCIARPSNLLNFIFMSTVNMAAKMLVSLASSSKAENTEKGKLADHLRFMAMLMTWLMLWTLSQVFDGSLPMLSEFLSGLSRWLVVHQAIPASSVLVISGSRSMPSSGSSLDLILRNRVDYDGDSFTLLSCKVSCL